MERPAAGDPVLCDLHLVAGLHQMQAQQVAEVLIILDDQDADFSVALHLLVFSMPLAKNPLARPPANFAHSCV